MSDEAFERIQLWASQLDPSDPLAIDLDEVLAAAFIGAAVKPRPIEKCGTGPIMIMGPDHIGTVRQIVLFKNIYNEWHDANGHVWFPQGMAINLSALPKPTP